MYASHSVSLCVCVLDKPVLIEKERLITISKDCDWSTAACQSFFCLQLKYIHLGTLSKTETETELKDTSSRWSAS